jgi:hypothetical protein
LPQAAAGACNNRNPPAEIEKFVRHEFLTSLRRAGSQHDLH